MRYTVEEEYLFTTDGENRLLKKGSVGLQLHKEPTQLWVHYHPDSDVALVEAPKRVGVGYNLRRATPKEADRIRALFVAWRLVGRQAEIEWDV